MATTVKNGNDCFKNGSDCFKWQRPFTKGKIAVPTLLETDTGLFQVLNVRRVLKLCLKSEVTLKVYFK